MVMATNNNNKQMSKKKNKPRLGRNQRERLIRRSDDDRIIRVQGDGNFVRATGRGSYSLAPLVTGMLSTVTEPLLGGLATLLGRGDYKVKKNSLVLTGHPPELESSSGGDFHRIKHREFLLDVISSASAAPDGSADFFLQSFPLNPGMKVTFPWLSGVAGNYGQYEILGAVVQYVPTSGNATGSNTSLGTVMLATNYNAAAATFINEKEMLNSEYATSGRPSSEIMHMIECEPHKNPISELYVRTGAVSGEDLKTYDLGLLQVASVGAQTLGQKLGQIFITYDIRLFKPLSTTSAGLNIATDHFQLTGVANSTPLGTSQTNTVAHNPLGGTINGATGTVYTYPVTVTEGTFLLLYQCQGTAASIAAPTITVNNSYSILNFWSNNSGVGVGNHATSPPNGVTSATFMFAWVIKIVADPVLPITFTFSGSPTLPSSTNYGDFLVQQLNASAVVALTPMQELQQKVAIMENLVQKLTRKKSVNEIRRDDDD